MNHEPREAVPGRSPEEGGTSADELAYRLHQQELLAGFGVLALRTPDFIDLLQEAARLGAQGLYTRYCKAMEYLPDEDRLIIRAGRLSPKFKSRFAATLKPMASPMVR
ncbi:hypothetical protein [Microvirga calopogonii]|uniref:hypothetical protein n=1 Tax=Microvirga calopogonii TaxID=2078013 RepID=UPI000E0D9342|nr:hypothetical protein [Microvirga calopogonii]